MDTAKDPQPHWTELAFARLLQGSSARRRSPEPTDAEAFLLYCARNLDKSNSQLFQDLFVCWKLEEKANGFFVEFGATNGADLSNTYQLEKRLSWKGILAEPARCWHEQLFKNRECAIETRCIWEETGKFLAFNEAPVPVLSTVHSLSGCDGHAARRENGIIYDVETISLNDLLAEQCAPSIIDYLSIDTEGSELSILESLDFHTYHFNIITVEHNGTAARDQIHDLLTGQGYSRMLQQFSRWDDWYVHASLA